MFTVLSRTQDSRCLGDVGLKSRGACNVLNVDFYQQGLSRETDVRLVNSVIMNMWGIHIDNAVKAVQSIKKQSAYWLNGNLLISVCDVDFLVAVHRQNKHATECLNGCSTNANISNILKLSVRFGMLGNRTVMFTLTHQSQELKIMFVVRVWRRL